MITDQDDKQGWLLRETDEAIGQGRLVVMNQSEKLHDRASGSNIGVNESVGVWKKWKLGRSRLAMWGHWFNTGIEDKIVLN